MLGPGEYLPDVTEGITRVGYLPKAKVIGRSRQYRLPFEQEKRDTEPDTDRLETRPTQKNLWKTWKVQLAGIPRCKELRKQDLRRKFEKGAF